MLFLSRTLTLSRSLGLGYVTRVLSCDKALERIARPATREGEAPAELKVLSTSAVAAARQTEASAPPVSPDDFWVTARYGARQIELQFEEYPPRALAWQADRLTGTRLANRLEGRT